VGLLIEQILIFTDYFNDFMVYLSHIELDKYGCLNIIINCNVKCNYS